MLDYSSMEVLNLNSGYFPVSGVWIWLILCVGFLFGLQIWREGNGILLGIFCGAVLSLLLTFLGMVAGEVDNSALVRFEVKEIQMTQDAYPIEGKYPYLKKDGDKVYYYTLIKRGIKDNPYEIKKATEKKFEKLAFNVENQRKK